MRSIEDIELLSARAHLEDSTPNYRLGVKYENLSEIKNLQRDVRDIKAQAGLDGQDYITERNFWGFVFDACYALRGHHEIHEVEAKIIADAKARNPESFEWRYSEEEFSMLAHGMMVYVLNTVNDDQPSRVAVEAKLRKAGNPFRIADFLGVYHK